MGTREVYEEELRRGNLHHDPTINPGLGSARCPRCLSLINPDSANGEWTITPVLRDASVVAGSNLGGLLTAVHGFNTGIPFLENRVRGPKWLPFVVGLPPLLLLSGVGAAFGAAEPSAFSRILSPSELGLKEEKITHLHFYFHDTLSGQNPSAIQIAGAPTTKKTSKTFFGGVMMMDDPLTVGPEKNSKLIGKAEGIYASASQTELCLLMVLNFAFVEGNFNGSNLSVLGRNAVFSGVREMPIVGGSGVFRFARGYAQAKTYWLNATSGDAIFEYNVYVFHH